MSDDRPVGRASWWLRSQDRGTLIFAALAGLVVLALLYIVIFVNNDDETAETTLTGEDATSVAVVEPVATSTPATIPTAVVEPTAVVIPTAIPTPEPTPELVTTTEDLIEGADNAESVENDTPDTSQSGAEGAADSGSSSGSSGSSGGASTFVPAATSTPVPTPVPTARPRPTPCVRDSIGNCVVAADDDISSQTLPADATPTPGGPTPIPVLPPSGSVSAACDLTLPGESLISFNASNNGFDTINIIVVVGGVVNYPALNAPAGTALTGGDALSTGFQIAGQSGQTVSVQALDESGNVTPLASTTVPTC